MTSKKLISIIVLFLIIILGFSAYLFYPIVKKRTKCPDYWGINDSFSMNKGDEIFIKNGENLNLTKAEKKWIIEKCGLNPIYSN